MRRPVTCISHIRSLPWGGHPDSCYSKVVNPIHRTWFVSLPHLSNKNLHVLSKSTKCLIHGDNLSSEWFLVLNIPHPLTDPEIMFVQPVVTPHPVPAANPLPPVPQPIAPQLAPVTSSLQSPTNDVNSRPPPQYPCLP